MDIQKLIFLLIRIDNVYIEIINIELPFPTSSLGIENLYNTKRNCNYYTRKEVLYMALKNSIPIDLYKYSDGGSIKSLRTNAMMTFEQLEDFMRSANGIARYSEDGTTVTKDNILEHFTTTPPACYISCDEIDESGNVTKMTTHGFTKVPNNQFSDKPSLQVVDISKDNISVIGDNAFKDSGIKTVIFGDTLTSIGENAFQNCSNLEITELPPGLTELKKYAFEECSKLNISSLPEGLTHTGFASLRRTAIESMTFPKSLVAIDHWTLAYCWNLKTIIFQSKVDEIVGNAFSFCDSLTDIYVPWSEGEVEGAPWGGSGATVHYDHVPN